MKLICELEYGSGEFFVDLSLNIPIDDVTSDAQSVVDIENNLFGYIKHEFCQSFVQRVSPTGMKRLPGVTSEEDAKDFVNRIKGLMSVKETKGGLKPKGDMDRQRVAMMAGRLHQVGIDFMDFDRFIGTLLADETTNPSVMKEIKRAAAGLNSVLVAKKPIKTNVM
jgi:hypothetical protein